MSKSVLDRVKAHFQEHQKRSLHVPEWDVTIFAGLMTVSDWSRARKFAGDDHADTRMIDVIISKCRDAEGKPIFEDDAETRATLEGGAAAPIINRIFAWIITIPSVEAEKNV